MEDVPEHEDDSRPLLLKKVPQSPNIAAGDSCDFQTM
jgi:hypothetical protein